MKNFGEQLKNYRFFLFSVSLVLIIDRAIKLILIFANYPYIKNYGIGFGLLSGHSALILTIVFFILVYLVYLTYYHNDNQKLNLALGTVFGGGVANLIDRLYYGYVIDYVNLKIWPSPTWLSPRLTWWPVFNFADMAVFLGVIIVLYYLVFQPDKSLNK